MIEARTLTSDAASHGRRPNHQHQQPPNPLRSAQARAACLDGLQMVT